MRRLLFAAAVVTLSLAGAQQAHAWGGFWYGVKLDWHRNNCWPAPFDQADRASVQAPFGVMIANGWQSQHTMDAYHFDTQTQQLTRQGQQKLNWILTQTPPERRTVFVLADADPQVTRSRMDAVQQTAARLVHEGSLPEVLITQSAPRGRSAVRINAMNVQAQEATPVPILPEMQAAGGGQ